MFGRLVGVGSEFVCHYVNTQRNNPGGSAHVTRLTRFAYLVRDGRI
jgi:hypothetical protein